MKKELKLFNHPQSAKPLFTVFCIFLVALLTADFFIHKHEEISLAGIPGFHALFGAASCLIMILLAKLLRFFVKRNKQTSSGA